jgi:hypothetical protein
VVDQAQRDQLLVRPPAAEPDAPIGNVQAIGMLLVLGVCIAGACYFLWHLYETAPTSPSTSASSPSASIAPVTKGMTPEIPAKVGDAPVQDADYNVPLVMAYLRANLNDPGSLSFAAWSKVVLMPDGDDPFWRVDCKFRAKNEFDALLLQNKVFCIAKGKVLYCFDNPGSAEDN